MRVLDLFSGIGGFSLGLERAGGFETVAFCEKDEYCQRVLAKHWPGVPIHDDITELDGRQFRGAIDVVCGGFPCQDLSVAGAQAGIDGSRSGLWSHLARIIGEVRPRYAIVENVTALLSGDRGRWFGRVLGDLASLGFDAEWQCIPAAALGAPHRRDRVWVVANARCDAPRAGSAMDWSTPQRSERSADARDCGDDVADAESERLPHAWGRIGAASTHAGPSNATWWTSEPDVGRVANGVPHRVDRLRALGNAVVPQVVTLLGEAILASEAA